MRQVLADGADLGRYKVEMVQQPFSRWCNELTEMDIVGQSPIGRPQDAGVVAKTGKETPGSP
jgi:hypothetical protein